MRKTTYETMQEVMDDIRWAIGEEFEDDFDIVAIAHDITKWKDGKLCYSLKGKSFWDVVAEHEISAA